MLAIYTEAIREANQQGRDLWQEATDLKYDLYAFSPEMLVHDRFNKWVTMKKVMKNLAFFTVDEAHMILTWGKTFRPSYDRLSAMRARLGSTVTWSAMSASVCEPGGRKDIQSALGFSPGRFHDERQPTDRTDLFYAVRFLKHSTEGLVFPDLAWCLPETEEELERLKPTIFSVGSIKKAIRLRNFLQHEIRLIQGPDPHVNVNELVTDFHALHSMADRKKKLEHVAEGRTVFLVCTLAANVGVNTKGIKRVVMVDAPSSFEEGTQWAGRAGRSGEGGEAILCIRDEMREETYSELHGDRNRNMKKLTDKQLEKRREIRNNAPSNIAQYCNPPPPSCRRDVSCAYYGERSSKPYQCCDICIPSFQKDMDASVDRWIEKNRARTNAVRGAMQSGDGGRPLDSSMRAEAAEELKHWREGHWDSLQSTDSISGALPVEFLVADKELDWLTGVMHIPSTFKHFEELLGCSAEPAGVYNSFQKLDADARSSLWKVVETLNIRCVEQHAANALKKSKQRKASTSVAKGKGKPHKRKAEDAPVDGEEDLNPLDMIGAQRLGGRRQTKPTERALYQNEDPDI